MAEKDQISEKRCRMATSTIGLLNSRRSGEILRIPEGSFKAGTSGPLFESWQWKCFVILLTHAATTTMTRHVALAVVHCPETHRVLLVTSRKHAKLWICTEKADSLTVYSPQRRGGEKRDVRPGSSKGGA